MKKLFISCPMRDRTDENIRQSIEKMHRIAEAMFGEPLEIISSYIPEDAPEAANKPIWYLGRSLQLLSDADFFIGITDAWESRGCYIEAEAAARYGISTVFVEKRHVAPDLVEVSHWGKTANTTL
mgnify:CR=1 FL=1